jgi:hypothetical protein
MLKSRDYSSGLAYALIMDEAFVRAETERTLRDIVDCIEVCGCRGSYAFIYMLW